MDRLHLSVVICTLNRPDDLLRTLRYFAEEETYHSFEVIIVDQSDTMDPTVLCFLAKNSPHFQASHSATKHLPKSRNLGIRLSKGDIIVFVDDDVQILPGFLTGHAAAFKDAGIAGATGPAFKPGSRELASAASLEQGDLDALVSGEKVLLTDFEYDICTLHGCNMSIRRSVLETIGYFDDFYGNYCDDVEISHRIKMAGGRLRYTPAAQLIHYQRQTGGTRDMPANSAIYIRNLVRSTVFHQLLLGKSLDLRECFMMFRRAILSRSGYRAGRFGFYQSLAFWQGVADARREFHRRKENTIGH
jgi:GT2 family glycosyltransferase